MTQRVSRPSQQSQRPVTAIQRPPGDRARRGGSGSKTIIPLPLYRRDVCGSLLGTMLFPNDPAKADTFAAKHLTNGALQAYRRAGFAFSLTQELAFYDAVGRELSSSEIETKELHGQRAGEVVKTLWTLICSHPNLASWDRAISMVEDESFAAGIQISRTTLRADLSEMRAVLHLWGALVLRNNQILADPNVDYQHLDDLAALMSEAMALLQQLCIWRDGRDMSDTLLAGDAFGPWREWQPHQPRPGWPDTGRIYRTSFQPSVRLPVRRPAGRPRGRKNPLRSGTDGY
jgi:hypothetical protein